MIDLKKQTERLTLTPISEQDLDLTVEMFTNPDVLKYAGGAVTEDEVRADMPKWTRRGGNGCIGIWCISLSSTGEKLGSVALLPMPVEDDDTDFSLVVPGKMPDADIEVGYFLRPAAWGKGYATEACRRIIQFAFEESPLEEVVACFEDENTASKNVLLKSGFVDRGRATCYGEDSAIFRVTRDEWLQERKSSN